MNRKYYKRFQIITPYFLFLFIIFNHVTTHATDEHEHHKHQLSHHHKRLDNPYGDQNLQDLYDMMAKMKFSGSVTIVNNLLKPVAISFKIRDDQEHDPFSFVTAIRTSIEERAEDLVDIIEGLFKGHKDKGQNPESKKGTIAPHHMLAANDFNPDIYMIAIKEGTAAINLISIKSGELKLSIEPKETQRALFPLPLKEFDFHPHLFQNIDDLPAWIQKRGHEVKPFGPKYPPEPNQSDEKFRKDYDSHLNFINMLAAPGEGIKDATEIYKKRAELFAQHSLKAQLERPLIEFKGQKPKIPLITHTIFLTNPNNPKEMPQRYIEWMLETAAVLDQKEGWKHNLWVVYEDLMPATMKQLKGTNIEPKSIYKNSKMKKLKDIPYLNNKELFEEALQSSLFGRASDIFRLEVLWKSGGIYRDTDYRFSQSPRWLNMWYDSYVGIEPMSTFIGNALLAMKPQHPIIKTAIGLVDRNLTDYTTPAYIEKITSDPQFTTVISTGPGMISFAFHAAAGEKGNADVAFPPALLYPSVIPQVYPQKDVLKPNDPVHPEALGVHFWETSWASKDFGSKG